MASAGKEDDAAFAATIAARDELARSLFRDIDQCKEIDFDKLRGVSGIRFSATTWEDLHDAIETNTPESLATLGRSPLALKYYWDTTRDLKLDWVSISDCLLAGVFGLTPERTEEGKLQTTLPPDFDDVDRVIWRKNDFPYWFEEGIQHHNIWCNRALSDAEVEREIERHRPAAEWETQWFKNFPALMSVPQLWHIHVLSRPRKTGKKIANGPAKGAGAAKGGVADPERRARRKDAAPQGAPAKGGTTTGGAEADAVGELGSIVLNGNAPPSRRA